MDTTIIYDKYYDIMHVGIGHDDSPPGPGSGRYRWGSGENPYQHMFNFVSEVSKLKLQGIKEAEIAEMLLGPKKKASDLKAEIALAKADMKKIKISEGQEMLERCNGNMSEAARRLGYKNESSLRSLLDPLKSARRTRYEKTADMIRKEVEDKGIIDISSDSNLYLGVPKNTMDIAVSMLEKEGYVKSYLKFEQLGTTHETSVKVLAKKDMTHKDIQDHKYEVKPIIGEFTPDEGKTWWTPEFPKSIDSKRVYIRYKEEGGEDKDGVIELRKGIEDISLGGPMYSQVRIAVDGTNYMKGMAIYSDSIPEGYDIVYNTNKKKGVPAIDKTAKYVYDEKLGQYVWTGKEVMKRLKINEKTMEVDEDNPFGALIKSPKDKDGVISAGGQRHYKDEDGNDQLSPINRLQDEGDWDNWSRKLSSQFLSKQPVKLIKQQIDLTVADKRKELDEILALTNPVIKQKLLDEFADNCDSNAADLKVKGFKNQSYRVILPVPELKDNEIYAPGLKDGEQIALIRYPHGGTFELPILTNNTKHKVAKSVIGNSADSVGINKHVAEIMSGADFDGDFAVTIPITSNNLKIDSMKPLKDLEGFDNKALYSLPESAPRMSNRTKQIEMGKVSNLITDMTLQGANTSEIARAVKHSMVVIDAEKHHLDYKQSAKDFNISELKKKYQGRINEETGKLSTGAATVISAAKNEKEAPIRKEVTNTKIMTPEELERWNSGKKVYRDTTETKKTIITNPEDMTPDELKIYNAGKKVYRDTGELKTQKYHRMDLVDDAFDLVYDKDNPKEVAYAEFANNLKRIGEEARRASRAIKPEKVDQTAKETYKEEVDSLNAKLRIAKSNNPRERQATIIGNYLLSEKRKSNPNIDFEHLKREKSLCQQRARAIVGAKKDPIQITDKEWEAIQANAISTNKLKEILANTDQEAFKQRATPRNTVNITLTPAQVNLIKSMNNSNYTLAEIADRLNVSVSTVTNTIKSS